MCLLQLLHVHLELHHRWHLQPFRVPRHQPSTKGGYTTVLLYTGAPGHVCCASLVWTHFLQPATSCILQHCTAAPTANDVARHPSACERVSHLWCLDHHGVCMMFRLCQCHIGNGCLAGPDDRGTPSLQGGSGVGGLGQWVLRAWRYCLQAVTVFSNAMSAHSLHTHHSCPTSLAPAVAPGACCTDQSSEGLVRGRQRHIRFLPQWGGPGWRGCAVWACVPVKHIQRGLVHVSER